MSDFTRDEILAAFRGFDACSERHDWDSFGSMMSLQITFSSSSLYSWTFSKPVKLSFEALRLANGSPNAASSACRTP